MIIPWNDLKNKPVQIKISNVYLVASPKTEMEFDPEEEDEREQQVKQQRLSTAELIASQTSKVSSGKTLNHTLKSRKSTGKCLIRLTAHHKNSRQHTVFNVQHPYSL